MSLGTYIDGGTQSSPDPEGVGSLSTSTLGSAFIAASITLGNRNTSLMGGGDWDSGFPLSSMGSFLHRIWEDSSSGVVDTVCVWTTGGKTYWKWTIISIKKNRFFFLLFLNIISKKFWVIINNVKRFENKKKDENNSTSAMQSQFLRFYISRSRS